jgi:uncharacterized repeat protein (TIGR04076 family)
MLETKVCKIEGTYPVYRMGDTMVIDNPRVLLDKTDAICTHAFSTLVHYVTILEHDWCPVKLGLTTSRKPDHAYMQCVDPGQPYAGGGTVVFECRRIKEDSSK